MEEIKKNYIGNICFNDNLTLATMASWADIVKSGVSISNLKEYGVPADKIEEIFTEDVALNTSNILYKLLTQTDVNMDNKITISLDNIDYEKNIYNYNLHLDNRNVDYKLKLDETEYQLALVQGNKEINYVLANGSSPDKSFLDRNEYIYTDLDKNIRYTRGFNNREERFRLEKDGYYLKINITIPFKMANDFNPDYKTRKDIILPDAHEKAIQSYLCNLSFPINYDEVISHISKLALFKTNIFNKYDIELTLKQIVVKPYKDIETGEDKVTYKYETIDKINKKARFNNSRIEIMEQDYSKIMNETDEANLDYEEKREIDRSDKLVAAQKYNLDYSLLDETDQNYWDAVWDEDTKKPSKGM